MNEQVNERVNDCHKEKVNTFQKQNVGPTRFLMAFVSLVHFFISKGIYCPILGCKKETVHTRYDFSEHCIFMYHIPLILINF